ncbi:MAG: aroK [Firmicutes bacterium]|nr:aroK [Bacillota bacterium]
MKNIVLLGFMGTGKTSIGRSLASKLQRRFVDLDNMIELDCGEKVSVIFAKHGESYFRTLEREMIVTVSHYKNTVIATGGGAVLYPENIDQLRRNGVLITLTADPAVILERTARKTSRPLLNTPDPKQAIATLLAERESLYQAADYIVDTSEGSVHEITDRIIALLKQGGHFCG